ncbi:ATP-dependent nuclease [Lacipirellula sp.]|uniref:ATP-dependent nuclease n=1 Tax=Lacipirellula sp. TaxID=2691419 RepID=UPI003D0DEAB6
MHLRRISLRHFRRLEKVVIDLEDTETVFVGPNNSGKTSVSAAFRCFTGKSSFSVHDFPAEMIQDIDEFGAASTASPLLAIELDLWFSFDENTEFGRVFALVPDPNIAFDEVGIRLRFGAVDAEKLKEAYLNTFPPGDGQKSLSHFLSLESNLSRHFAITYFALESASPEPLATALDPQEGRRVLESLLRIDFVEAQRNIHEQEMARSNRLSSAFADYYKRNLEQAEVSEEANKIIDVNNDNLTKHYDQHFSGLMGMIQSLGVPSINDRSLKLVSSLKAEEALRGSTSLFYVDAVRNHQLPEAYNGLGFKNLIYVAIQVCHYQMRWIRTEKSRPLCQLIFIEEPEVHLHAQVQQTFITNIWKIVQATSKDAGQPEMLPQLVVTTHSSHILDSVEFSKVRYFRRCHSLRRTPAAPNQAAILNATEVVSLRDFQPTKKSAAGTAEDANETLTFLRKYLRLTHCDLFFADAAILVEGAGEKLLLAEMIDESAATLRSCYVSVLEVGGAYASKFASLLEFLCVPYLVITDIDSVDPKKSNTVCRADHAGACSSNATLGFFFSKKTIVDYIAIKATQQVLANGACYVAYQRPVPTSRGKEKAKFHARTFEEALIYENLEVFRLGKGTFKLDLSSAPDLASEYDQVFSHVASSAFKKTEFALDVLTSTSKFRTPTYIADGLKWLEGRIRPVAMAQVAPKSKPKPKTRSAAAK